MTRLRHRHQLFEAFANLVRGLVGAGAAMWAASRDQGPVCKSTWVCRDDEGPDDVAPVALASAAALGAVATLARYAAIRSSGFRIPHVHPDATVAYMTAYARELEYQVGFATGLVEH